VNLIVFPLSHFAALGDCHAWGWISLTIWLATWTPEDWTEMSSELLSEFTKHSLPILFYVTTFPDLMVHTNNFQLNLILTISGQRLAVSCTRYHFDWCGSLARMEWLSGDHSTSATSVCAFGTKRL